MFSKSLNAAKAATPGTESIDLSLQADQPIEIVSMEEAMVDLLTLQDDIASLEAMSSDVTNLDALSAALESTGMSRALIAFADRELMLSTAIPSVPGLESMGADLRPGDLETVAALEGIGDAIKNTMARLASKASEVAGKVKDKVLKLASAAAEKAKEFGSWIKGKVFDAKATVAAHPKETVLALLAGIAAVGGVIAVIWGGGLPATTAAFTTWTDKVVSAVKGLKIPGFSAVGKSIKDLQIGFKLGQAAKKTLSAIGWTFRAIDSFATDVGNAAANSMPVKAIGNLLETKIGGAKGAFANWVTRFAVGNFVRGFTRGVVLGLLGRMIALTFKLVRTVIGGIVMAIGTTISALRGAFRGKSESAEPAAA